MQTTKILHQGISLEIPIFLKDIWPYELTLRQWPSFCGVGSGLGDRIVPDAFFFGMAILKPACFIHDICWCICPNTKAGFDQSNKIFRDNLMSLTDAQLMWPFTIMARHRCDVYYELVSTVGRLYFSANNNKDCVNKKLKRLGIW
jgi:hypothetical protein